MKIFGSVLVWGIALAFLSASNGQAAGMTALCKFQGCTAQLTQTELQVSCEGKTLYEGAYELTTDFQTTWIESDEPSSSRITITTPGIPTIRSKTNAALRVSGKSIPGNCVLNSN